MTECEICDGHHVLDEIGLLLRQFLDQLLHLAIGEEVRHVLLQHLGEMRREHGRRVDDRVAAERGFLAQAVVHPGGRQAEGGLDRVQAGQVDLLPAGSMTMWLPGCTLPVPASTSFTLIM